MHNGLIEFREMAEAGDGGKDLQDDENLPPDLSDQLGQLILGAAQHFNADNPNLGLNFAHVFGGDEDFGMNPGDEDMFLFDDSDSDSYMEDNEDSIQQIFTSLGDSHVIRRLSFHKTVGATFRVPRVNCESVVSYEEVYRLLEELELLCRAWRRRVEHPFTAHIVTPSQAGEWLREGEDYNSSDYEYESEEEEVVDRLPPGQINESLTKKKFCQSAKVFHQIFPVQKQFDSFQRFLSRVKKYVFRVIFQLFLDALPPVTRLKIPRELWEKIWKFTQNSYFRYKSAVPLSVDTSYYRAGLQAGPGLARLEQDRIKELFASLGNLHMLVFEVLFKNPHLLQPSALLELEVAGVGELYCSAVWKTASQAARTAFCRLQQLQQLLGSPDKLVVGEQQLGGEPGRQLDRGCRLVRDLQMQLGDTEQLDPPTTVITSPAICPHVALPGRYPGPAGRLRLLLTIVELERAGRVVQTIETEYSYESHLMDVGSSRVLRMEGRGWRNHFHLTKDRISFLSRQVDKVEDRVEVWSVAITSDGAVVQSGPPLVSRLLGRPGPASQFRHSSAVWVAHCSSGLLLLHQSAYSLQSGLELHCLTTGELLQSLTWQEDVALLSCSPGARALLRSATRQAVMLFSLAAGEVVTTWQESELGGQQGEEWSGVFDSCGEEADQAQLLLHTPTLSSYCLLGYSPHNELAQPVVLVRANKVETVEAVGPGPLLLRGLLLSNTRAELAALEPGDQVPAHRVAAFSLAGRIAHSLLCMGADPARETHTALNQLDWRWWDPAPGPAWQPERRPLCLVTPTRLAVLLETPWVARTVELGLSAREVVTADAEQLCSKTVSKKSKQELMLKRKEIAKQLLNTDKELQGIIVDWKGTYGFIKASKGKAKQLGKIFCHVNDISNAPPKKKFRYKGAKLVFKLQRGKEEGSYKAAVVNFSS